MWPCAGTRVNEMSPWNEFHCVWHFSTHSLPTSSCTRVAFRTARRHSVVLSGSGSLLETNQQNCVKCGHIPLIDTTCQAHLKHIRPRSDWHKHQFKKCSASFITMRLLQWCSEGSQCKGLCEGEKKIWRRPAATHPVSLCGGQFITRKQAHIPGRLLCDLSGTFAAVITFPSCKILCHSAQFICLLVNASLIVQGSSAFINPKGKLQWYRSYLTHKTHKHKWGRWETTTIKKSSYTQ